jgi:hypothetical protein
MIARMARFEGGSNDRLRELNEERMRSGSLGMPDGVQRMLVLANGDDGRLLVTFFESREALDAAAEQFESMGDEIPEEIRGKRTSVEVFDVLYDAAP